jgi:hypothetical protein
MCHGYHAGEWSRDDEDAESEEVDEHPSLSEPEEATEVEILTDGGDE